MKKAKKMLALVAIFAFVLGFQSCKAGCNCPKFSVQQAK